MGYPNGLYSEKLNQAYYMKYGEWISPSTFGFSSFGKLLDSFQDVLNIRWFTPEEGKLIIHLKSTGGGGNGMVIYYFLFLSNVKMHTSHFFHYYY